MTDRLDLAEIDAEIREIRANLRELVERETARSGAADEDQGDSLIAAQEAKLARLLEERAKLEV